VEIVTWTLGPMENNVYLLYNESEKSIVVDPSWNTNFILNESKKYKPIGLILLTHGHFDHSLSASKIKMATGAEIWIHELDAAYLEWNVNKAKLEFGIDYPPTKADHTFVDGEIIKLGNEEIKVIHTPGHTPGGVCFFFDNALIAGDTIFEGSVGRWDFTGGDGHTLMNSIQEKIITLDDDIIIYPGHGGCTTVGKERKYNPFMRGDAEAMGLFD